jgi:glycosyltransferase involved in cell wall biosynthesis
MGPVAQLRKILMVNLTNIAEGEGGALHQLSLARCFREIGHTVRIIAPARHGREGIPPDVGSFLTLSFSLTSIGLPGSLDALVQLPMVVWWRLRHGFDVLYIRANMLTWVLALAARLLGMRVVVEHNSWMASERVNRGGSSIAAWIERHFQVLSAQLAHLSRTVTKGIKRLLGNDGVPPSKMVVIGNGTDTSFFHPIDRVDALKELGWDPSVTWLGFIGILSPWQGVETALNAFAFLGARPDMRLVIAGDGPERGRLETLARKLDIQERVDFLGYVPREQANLVINGFDIALAPFTRERNSEIGLSPIKIRDYAAAGRLVISADIPELSDLEEFGWMVLHKPDDGADLARQISRCLGADFDKQAAQLAARSYAEANFDWNGIAQRLARQVSPQIPPK